jgi:hypothetical protein
VGVERGEGVGTQTEPTLAQSQAAASVRTVAGGGHQSRPGGVRRAAARGAPRVAWESDAGGELKLISTLSGENHFKCVLSLV